MKRFASHYLYIPLFGFLKQYVVEINECSYVTALYPLEEEAESIIWTPGVIRLVPYDSIFKNKAYKKGLLLKEIVGQVNAFDITEIKKEPPTPYENTAILRLAAIRIYPFNFTQMKPVENSTFQILDNQIF